MQAGWTPYYMVRLCLNVLFGNNVLKMGLAATNWNGLCQVGFAPTRETRLFVAYTN